MGILDLALRHFVRGHVDPQVVHHLRGTVAGKTTLERAVAANIHRRNGEAL